MSRKETTVGETEQTTTAGPAHTPPREPPQRYEVTEADLPLHCPLDSMSLWNTHPRVYLPIEEAGEVVCPYCGAHYVLRGGRRKA